MRTTILITALLCACTSFVAGATSPFAGQVVDEQNQAVANAQITVQGQSYKTDKNGGFSLPLSGQGDYQIRFQAKGFYDKVYHFSSAELARMPEQTFTLVQQKPGRVLMAFGGDVMMGRRYYSPYFNDPTLIAENSILADSKEILRHVKPYLALADFAAVNLESQIAETKPSQRAPKGVTFYSRPETVEALQWAGIDYVTLGNNHTYDYLDEGLQSTLQALDKKGLSYSGAGLTEEQALAPHIYQTPDLDYAMLGYVGWQGTKAIKQAANAEQGGAAFGTMENILEAVTQAKAEGQVPLIQYHGSLEYSNEPTGVTEQRLKAGLDAGAAMAIAHHPHVAQGLELYNNKLIAYSMGNFVFDQNFSSTQLSLLLYVWLDRGEFHRAEIVPLYVKGYKPTPAMDLERDNLLKRLITLSEKRNTKIVSQGGHGVITSEQSWPEKAVTVAVVADNSKTQLLQAPVPGLRVSEVVLPRDIKQYRLGTNLVNGGDFEQFTSFNTQDRGIAFDNQIGGIVEGGYNSDKGLALALDNTSAEVAMTHFRRVYKPDTPVTFKMDVLTEQGVTVNLYWQGRKTRQKLFDAFENSPKQLIKSLQLKGDKQWQALEIDFNAPRIGYRSYRVLAELAAADNSKQTLVLDNFSLIQWQTAYQSNRHPMTTDDGGQMANYIGFSANSDQAVQVKLK